MVPEKIDRYLLLERTARYGVTEHFTARDTRLGRLVTLEARPKEPGENGKGRSAVLRAASEAWASLDHPNVVRLHDFGETADWYYRALDLLDGTDLRRVLNDRIRWPLAKTLSTIGQVCEGVEHIHRSGIVHRDIKPAHIFLPSPGGVKIIGFGAAIRVSGREGGSPELAGTLRYIPPEQARGQVDPRSDMFAVGAVLYELLALRPAFDVDDRSLEDAISLLIRKDRMASPPTLTDLDAAIPSELAAIVHRAIQLEPERRFRDMAEMRSQLQALRLDT